MEIGFIPDYVNWGISLGISMIPVISLIYVFSYIIFLSFSFTKFRDIKIDGKQEKYERLEKIEQQIEYLKELKSRNEEMRERSQKEISNNRFFYDKTTRRTYSASNIKGQIPYTKHGRLWLISRENLNNKYYKNSIEIVKKPNKTYVVRYWNKNRIDGLEILFYDKLPFVINKYNKGTLISRHYDENEIEEFLALSYPLYSFFYKNSPYVRSFPILSYFL